MNANQTIKQIFDFNKNTFDNTFNAMMNIGEQNEKMFRSFMDQTWLPEEGKRAIMEWVDIYRKGWIDFKKAADENYKAMAKHLGGEQKTSKA